MRVQDVVVVGGGPIGLVSAWRAAQAGLSVTVCDPTPGGGAADVAAGMLAAVTEAWFGEEALTALGVESARRWPAFAADVGDASGVDVDFAEGGTLLVAYDADDLAVVNRVGALHETLRLDAKRLRARDLRGVEPALSPRVRGGLLARTDHRVDPRAMCRALLIAGEKAGVVFRRDRVERIDADGGRVTGVTLADGETLTAGVVVLAAGAWSGQIDGPEDLPAPPVRPVKGEVVTLRAQDGQPPLLDHTVRAYVHGTPIYLVPRSDGRVVIGATMDERGFDTAVTAGGVYELLRDATLVVPGVDELAIAEVRAGLRPGTPDNAPILGWGGIDGLLVATGHFRSGILLTPITGDAVVALLTGAEPPPEIQCCRPDRFT